MAEQEGRLVIRECDRRGAWRTAAAGMHQGVHTLLQRGPRMLRRNHDFLCFSNSKKRKGKCEAAAKAEVETAEA